MLTIKCRPVRDAVLSVPGSKSYSHRILIAAALADGRSRIENYLKSEDTYLTLNAMKQMGIVIEPLNGALTVQGTGGRLAPCRDEIFLGNSGTSMRLLTAVAALGEGVYRLNGTKRMQQRPISDLLNGLAQLGVVTRSLNDNGCPPIEISGGRVAGGAVELDCSLSSQYLSALLLIAPYTRDGLDILVTKGPVSKPYIDMTLDVMEQMGISFSRDAYRRFQVSGRQCYRAGAYTVESDASQAGYFWAAAAVSGTTVKVKGIERSSRQGDVGFTRVLEAMGCRVTDEPDGISVTGGELSAVAVDMADMPDMVPTLAVVAAFADGTSVIKNVGHLKAKESNRLAAVAAELEKMGIEARYDDAGLTVRGGTPHGAVVETYRDHRIAMSFAVAGLRVPGVVISNENCVEKSFPDFWQVFEGLYRT